MTRVASHWKASVIRSTIVAQYVGGSKIFAPLPFVSGPAVVVGTVTELGLQPAVTVVGADIAC